MVLAGASRSSYPRMVGISPEGIHLRHFVYLFPILILLAFGIRSTLAAQKLPTITVLVAPDVKIEAELAYTDANRSRGLMFRENLPPDAGMLFLFPTLETRSFW